MCNLSTKCLEVLVASEALLVTRCWSKVTSFVLGLRGSFTVGNDICAHLPLSSREETHPDKYKKLADWVCILWQSHKLLSTFTASYKGWYKIVIFLETSLATEFSFRHSTRSCSRLSIIYYLQWVLVMFCVKIEANKRKAFLTDSNSEWARIAADGGGGATISVNIGAFTDDVFWKFTVM